MQSESLSSGKILSSMAAMTKAAEEFEVAAAFTIVDSSGLKLGYLKMPGSFLASEQYAFQKAYTAASFSMPTSKFANMLAKMDGVIHTGLLHHPDVTGLPGGLPVMLGGVLVGGIGVSGGSGDQDEMIVQAGLSALSNEES